MYSEWTSRRYCFVVAVARRRPSVVLHTDHALWARFRLYTSTQILLTTCPRFEITTSRPTLKLKWYIYKSNLSYVLIYTSAMADTNAVLHTALDLSLL